MNLFSATLLCLFSTYIISGGYMLLHTPKGKDITIDFQFAAPQSASKDMFKNDISKSEKVCEIGLLCS